MLPTALFVMRHIVSKAHSDPCGRNLGVFPIGCPTQATLFGSRPTRINVWGKQADSAVTGMGYLTLKLIAISGCCLGVLERNLSKRPDYTNL
jgi:hypothetical protein